MKVTSLACLNALAHIIPDKSKIKQNEEGTDAVLTLAYVEDSRDGKDTVSTVQCDMSLINAAYVGIVRLWPTMKTVKDSIALKTREEAKAAILKARTDKAAEYAKGVADRKALALKTKQEKAAAKDAARAARADAKALRDKTAAEARTEALRLKEEARKAKDEAKEKADAAKLKAAADAKAARDAKPAARAVVKGPVVTKSAAARAVAAVKASAPKGKAAGR